MTNEFEILAGFLDRFAEDVEGREMLQLDDQARTSLRDFARGKLPPTEQAKLIELLHQNPHWIAGLADEVKALRNQPPGS